MAKVQKINIDCTVEIDAAIRNANFTNSGITPTAEFQSAIDKVLTSVCTGGKLNTSGWDICQTPAHKDYFNNFILKNITS